VKSCPPRQNRLGWAPGLALEEVGTWLELRDDRTFDRMRSKVAREEAVGKAKGELLGDDIDGRFHALEREQKIDAMLEEIKSRKRLSA